MKILDQKKHRIVIGILFVLAFSCFFKSQFVKADYYNGVWGDDASIVWDSVGHKVIVTGGTISHTNQLRFKKDSDQENYSEISKSEIEHIEFKEGTYLPKDSSGLFSKSMFPYLRSVEGKVSTKNVTDMSGLFNDASKLTSLDIGEWDTSSVTSMNFMFKGASSLTTLDVNNWDTSNVEVMSFMFEGASSLKSIQARNWNTSNVKLMNQMFKGATSLEELDVSNWDTSNAETGGIFTAATSLNTLTIGEKSIILNSELPIILDNNTKFTNNWVKIGMISGDNSPVGTVYNSYSDFMGENPKPGKYTRELKTDSISLYRVYNPNSGEHLYTSSKKESDILSSLGWKFEGIAWKSAVSGTPVYRAYNPNSGEHFYTLNTQEYNHITANGWKKEGIAFYSDNNKGQNIYRLFNPNSKGAGSHHYTTNLAERNYLISIGWKNENIAFYGVK